MNLTLEQIRQLAEIERQMDAGTQPYVVNRGHRWAFPGEVLAHLEVTSGQTVSDVLLLEIMKANVLNVQRELEREEKASSPTETPAHD